MSSVTGTGTGNFLLDMLPAKKSRTLIAASELVHLSAGRHLCERQKKLAYVCFPLTAFLLLVSDARPHPSLGIMMIGNEGMLGATVLLGIESAPLRAIVQGEGSAYLVGLPVFRGLLRENSAFSLALGHYLYRQFGQLVQGAVCNRFHEVEARLVRWLLLTHDRADSDSLHFTHQVLAGMLGVRRSAVTIAAGVLQQKSLISYSRGEITITDREGLEAICCGCYRLLTDRRPV